MGRGARVLRRHGRREPPLRHVLVPPHRPAAHQAQHPARRRRVRGRAGLAIARLARRRPPVQHRLRCPHRRREPGARRDPADEPGLRARPLTAHLQRRRPQGLHLAAAGGLPRDGVRRAARGRSRRAPRGATRRRRVRLEDQLPGGDPGRAGRRHPAVDGVRARLLLPRVPHPPPLRLAHPRGVHRGDGAGDARPRRPARTGASCTPGPRPTWRRRTRASATSSRCATGSTPTGSSPTPTSSGCSAPDRASAQVPLQVQGAPWREPGRRVALA